MVEPLRLPRRRITFSINDDVDLLTEILCRLDGPSLGVAACVCRLWSAVCHMDATWERLWGRHIGGATAAEVRPVVAALGGHQQLYRVCVGPVVAQLRAMGRARTWGIGRIEAQLSISLFSIDCYEGMVGTRSSLMFLCKAR